MAKVMNPLNSTEARGKVGGLIYNRNAGGNYVKAFASPTQPRTTNQLRIRAYMQIQTRAWQSLGASDRTSWNDWASNHPIIDWTGNSVVMSGFNAYCAMNVRLTLFGFATVDTAPVVAAPDAIAGASATGAAGEIDVAWTPTAGTNMSLVAYYQHMASAGRQPSRSRAKLHTAWAGETSPATITGLAPGSYAVWLYVVSEDDGQISPAILKTATVT